VVVVVGVNANVVKELLELASHRLRHGNDDTVADVGQEYKYSSMVVVVVVVGGRPSLESSYYGNTFINNPKIGCIEYGI
jgi:hypothetical protein